MDNYFSIYNLKNSEEQNKVNRNRYAIFCIILTLIVMFSFYLLLLILPYRDERVFYFLGAFVILLYFIQVYLQYYFTQLLKRNNTGILINQKIMLDIRQKLNYRWFEFLLPVLLLNIFKPPFVITLMSVFVIVRLLLIYRNIVS